MITSRVSFPLSIVRFIIIGCVWFRLIWQLQFYPSRLVEEMCNGAPNLVEICLTQMLVPLFHPLCSIHLFSVYWPRPLPNSPSYPMLVKENIANEVGSLATLPLLSFILSLVLPSFFLVFETIAKNQWAQWPYLLEFLSDKYWFITTL